MTSVNQARRSVFRFGVLAYLGAAVSLAFCFWKSIFIFVGPILGLTFVEINPHLQAVLMWLFAAVAERPSIRGVYRWKWFTDPTSREEGADGFSPRGKLAERVLRSAYHPDCR